MSRFRAYRAKDKKWYVVTTDTNGLAGGPYENPAEAQARADRLAKLEEMQAQRAAQPEAHRMNITKGYRSPDVEDMRGVVPTGPARQRPEFYPPWIQRNMKWSGVPKGQLPPPEWGTNPAARHHIPVDPNDLNAEGVPFGEAERQFEERQKKYWAEMAKDPQPVGVDLRTREIIFDKPLDIHVMAKQAQQREAARGAQPPWSTPPPPPAPPKKKP